MPIIAKRGDKAFTPAPQGSYQAVCVDCIDLGMVESTWDGETKSQHKIALVWQITEKMPDGKPYLVTQRYTLSLGDRSKLRPLLESWRGKPFTEAELDGFVMDNLIGANCLMSIVHRQGSKGGTFANVASCAPLLRGMPKIVGEGYIRKVDREPPAVEPEDHAPNGMLDDSDIPFSWLLPLLLAGSLALVA